MSKSSPKQRAIQLDEWIKFMMNSSNFRKLRQKKRKPQYLSPDDNSF